MSIQKEFLLYKRNMDALLAFDDEEIDEIIREARREADKKYKEICTSDERYIKVAQSERRVLELTEKLNRTQAEISEIRKKCEDKKQIYVVIDRAVTKARFCKSVSIKEISELAEHYCEKSKSEEQYRELTSTKENLKKEIEKEIQLGKKYRSCCTVDPKSFDLLDYMKGDKKNKVEGYLDALTKVWINNTWFGYSKNYNHLRKLVEFVRPVINIDPKEIFNEEFSKYLLEDKDIEDIGADAYLKAVGDATDFSLCFIGALKENLKNPRTKGFIVHWKIDGCAAVRDNDRGIKLLNSDPLPEDDDIMNAFVMQSISPERMEEMAEAIKDSNIVDAAIKILGESDGLNGAKRFIVE